MGRILKDMACAVSKSATPWNGGAIPTFPAGTSVMARLYDIDIDDKLNGTNVAGAGPGRVANRYAKGEGKIKLRFIVGGGGYLFKAPGAPSPLGYWVQCNTKPDSLMITADIWAGVITNWHVSGSRDEAQYEEVEIDMDPDVDPLAAGL